MQTSKTPQPTVSYPGDPHLLAVLEDKPSQTSPCKECGDPCDSTPFFHCTHCKSNLHLRCGPLTKTIKSKYHVDPLDLADQYAEDNSGEYYCDLCEKRRDPRDCVYVCSKCNFVAHLSCMMPEVHPVPSNLCILVYSISPIMFHLHPTGEKQSLFLVTLFLLGMLRNKP